MALPTVTVTGTRGSSGGGGGGGALHVSDLLPGSTISRGDPHGGFGEFKKKQREKAAKEAQNTQQGLNPTDSTPPSAPEPDATAPEPDATPVNVSEPLQEVVVQTNRPTIVDVDPGAYTYVTTPSGDTVTPAPPYPGPRTRPLPLGNVEPVPSQQFLGPQPVPEPLPEVVVQAPPPAQPPKVPVPSPAAFAFPNPYALGFALLLTPRVANLGEQERINEQRRAELSQLLLPVQSSATRLPEPVDTVTVVSTRISDRAATRTPRGILGDALRGLSLRQFGIDFLAKPTSVLKPTPQKRPRRVVNGSSRISFDTGTTPTAVERVPINSYFNPQIYPAGPAPTPRPAPEPIVRPEPGTRVGAGPDLLVPVFPGSGALPSPTVTPFAQPQPLPQYQGQCQCPKVEQKTKKKKRRRVRTKCYRGTFIEKDNRVNKQRLEEIPCDSDLRTKKYAKLRRKPPPRAKTKYSTGLPGIPKPKRK